MIIPIKCFTCGMLIADKYSYYIEEVRRRKLGKESSLNININSVTYFTKEFREKTIEGHVLDELSMNKMCCRRHFLTHVDIE